MATGVEYIPHKAEERKDMEDWIDQIKKRDEDVAECARRDDDIRQRRTRIVRTKAPAFWREVILQIRYDLEKLRTNFPNILERQADLISCGNSDTLRSKKSPICILEMELNLDRSQIDLSQVSKRDRYDDSILTPIDPIAIQVDDKEELSFVWRRYSFRTSSDLAERLINHVCQSMNTRRVA